MQNVLVNVAEYSMYGTLEKLYCALWKDALTSDKTITVFATNERYGVRKQFDWGGLLYLVITLLRTATLS